MAGALLQPQTITFANPGTQTVGTPLTLSATATSGLPVGYSSSTPLVCTVAGTKAAFLTAGTCTITASQTGSSTYSAATPVSRSFSALLTQTTSFGAIASQVQGSTLTVSAKESSGLPVIVATLTPSVCTVSGTVVSLPDPGTCTVQATQLGNSTYAPATPISQSFTVLATQTISFSAIANQVQGTSFALSAKASSSLPVTYASLTPSVCTVSANAVSLPHSGKCTIQATQLGSSTYAPAIAISQSFTVLAAQTISFSTIATKVQGTTVALGGSASSGLAVTYNSLTPSVCTVLANTISLPHPGTCTIQATQSGNDTYAPATPVQQSFTVSAAFTITASSSQQTVIAGLFDLVSLRIQSATAFTGLVSLSCSGGPAGSSCLGFPQQTFLLNGSALALANIYVPFNSPKGSYTETFTLTSGSLTDIGTTTFTVVPLL